MSRMREKEAHRRFQEIPRNSMLYGQVGGKLGEHCFMEAIRRN